MSSSSTPSRSRWNTALWPYLLLMVPPLCWGGNAVLARGVVDLIPPISLAFWRWIVALAILYPITRHRVREDWETALRSWKWMLVLSFLGITSFNSLLYTAAHTTTAINVSMIQTIMPAIIIVISLALFREKIRLIQLAGVILSIGGACFVLLRGEWQTLLTLSFLEGDLLMLIAVVIYALYSVLLRKRPAIHPLSFVTLTFAWGALLRLPFYLWELFSDGPFRFGYAEILSILYVAVFPSIVAYLCWNRGVELLGANRAGLFVNLVPLFASGLAILLLGESLQGFHLVGLALIFGGMALFNWLSLKPN
jgi:drug/metabolite transporter (DMT)-like permease